MSETFDFHFSRTDLLDVLCTVKIMIEAELTPNFSGGHVILVHKAWEASPSGVLWAAFVFKYDCGEVTDTTLKLFSREDAATDYLDDIIENDFHGPEQKLATRH